MYVNIYLFRIVIEDMESYMYVCVSVRNGLAEQAKTTADQMLRALKFYVYAYVCVCPCLPKNLS